MLKGLMETSTEVHMMKKPYIYIPYTYIYSSIPFNEIHLNIPIQATAATVNPKFMFTIGNIYNQLIIDLVGQLPRSPLFTYKRF